MNNKYTRDFEPSGAEVKDNVLTFSVASSAPYTMKDKDGKYVDEVLVISEEAIDFVRLIDQRCPFLYEHDTDKQLGVVEKAWIKDEKLYVSVRFSEGFEAQEVLADIKSGIRRNVSIGYNVDEWKEVIEPGKVLPTKLCTRWTPFECSSVSCPADYTVGYERSLKKKVRPPPPPHLRRIEGYRPGGLRARRRFLHLPPHRRLRSVGGGLLRAASLRA